MLKPAELSPGHTLLARLSGSWELEGDWYLLPGQGPTPISGQMVNSAIYNGLFIESRVSLNAVEASRVIYGFDQAEERYMAFAINALSARSDLESGCYDAEGDALCFTGTEPVGADRRLLRFQRLMTFVTANAVDMEISYPDYPPEKRLGMCIRMRR